MIARRSILSVFLLLFSAISFSQCVSGEPDPVNTLTRRILGPTGKSVPRVAITVRDPGKKVLFETHSDAHGKFTIPRLKGNPLLYDKQYRVEVFAPGFLRYHYDLLPSASSHRVQQLVLVPSSKSNDMKVITE